MKSLIYAALLCTVCCALVIGCQRQDVLLPPEIHYGVKTCADCGMIINDPHFAAALAWRNPSDGTIQTAAFDDIGCLLGWRRDHARVPIAAVWVKSVYTGAWLDATSAVYVKSPRLQTPMGWGVVAGTTTNEFAALPVQQPLLAWTNLLTVQDDQTDNATMAGPAKKGL